MRMIPKKETLTIEFKSDTDCLDEKELVSEIVGMTNTEGGVLYLGVEDNGDVTGVHKKHKDPNGAMALIANKTVPSLSVRAEIIEEEVFSETIRLIGLTVSSIKEEKVEQLTLF